MEAMQVEFWYWLILGVAFLALEIFAPGAILMWFGFGAIVTGVLLWLMPGLGVAWQVIIFAILSVASLLLWWQSRFFREDTVESDKPELGNRLTSHIGKEYTLTEAIINGRGSMRVGDTSWRVRGPDLPAGTRVKVTGVDGVLFTVEPTS